MPSDEKAASDVMLLGDPSVMPTDDKLKADAGSLVSQYLHFWDPGEVECTVILSRPNSREVVYATSVVEHERLKHSLTAVRRESFMQKVLVSKHKLRG